MFNKWTVNEERVDGSSNGKTDNSEKQLSSGRSEVLDTRTTVSAEKSRSAVNTILKGSKLTGDINVTCDLVLSGDVEGNIRSSQDSSIVIKGTCKGNIETAGGSVDIEGILKGGNITAGSDVKITGTFNGGEILAKGSIHVNGEFNGKLQGREVEIGANAKGKGQIFYDEHISIAKGARVEVQIARAQQDGKSMKSSPEKKVVDIKPQSKDKGESKQA